MGWIPVLTLPNVDVQCGAEGKYAAIVRYHDKRLATLRHQHPKFRRFLNGFRDAFGRIERPSVLILREDKYETYRNSEALCAFRDLLAISTIPYARAWVLKHGSRHSTSDPVYSNVFGFYPWMIDIHYDGMIANTPAQIASDETTKFSGRLSPEIGYYIVNQADEPLLKALIERWEKRFDSPSPTWSERALFRSLSTAYYAAQTPFHTAGTEYDSGRLVGLWVSAFEILAHKGPGNTANKAEVLKVLCPATAASRDARKTVYSRLNQARSNFLHGDDVSGHQPGRLMHFGSVLYRLMLTEFLGLHRARTIPSGPRTKEWAEKVGKEIAAELEFEGFQDQYEKALAAYLNPPPDPRANHRRIMRTRNDNPRKGI